MSPANYPVNETALERLSVGDIKTVYVNAATAQIVEAYLIYTSSIVQSVLSKQTLSMDFKEINDDLIVKPDELLKLVDDIQRALKSVE